MQKTTNPQLNAIAQIIYDKKGINILALDLRATSNLTDYVIIAEGNIDRHVRAIAQTIKSSLDETGTKPLNIEGEQDGDWIVLDYGQIIVHLFVPELRMRYSLEDLWRDSSIVDVNIKVEKENSKNSDFY